MDAHSTHEIKKHVAVYIKVFVALGVLTAVTVGVSYIHLADFRMAIGLAMLVALVKGTLVAGYFMHLFSERKIIFATLILCAVFFVTLLALPAFTTHENRTVPNVTTVTDPAPAEHAAEHH